MKKSILLCLLLTSVIGIIGGCSKNVGLLEPKLKSYDQIAVAPFLTDKTSQGMERRFAIDLATRLSLAEKEKTLKKTIFWGKSLKNGNFCSFF